MGSDFNLFLVNEHDPSSVTFIDMIASHDLVNANIMTPEVGHTLNLLITKSDITILEMSY